MSDERFAEAPRLRRRGGALECGGTTPLWIGVDVAAVNGHGQGKASLPEAKAASCRRTPECWRQVSAVTLALLIPSCVEPPKASVTQPAAKTAKPTKASVPAYLAIPKASAGLSYPETTALAFEMEEAADIVVEFTDENKLLIERRGSQKEAFPAEFKDYFDRQKRKEFIVVIFQKRVRSEAEDLEDVRKLNAYFTARGYKRIVIQQARGGGRPIHSDITNVS